VFGAWPEVCHWQLVHRKHRDLLVTRDLLRHSSVATTMIYAAVESEDMAAALEGLPQLTA
jgi:hypothetical protein